MKREQLPDYVLEALHALGGSGTIVQICKHIWDNHEQELRNSGNLFYCWQYDMRWAGQQLRDNWKLVKAKIAPKGVWTLTENI